MEKKLEKALGIIEDLDWETVECGTYTVDDDIFYMVQEYETKHPQEARYEAHEKYVDIQYIVKGEERMEFADATKLKVDEVYNAEKDVVFFIAKKLGGENIAQEEEVQNIVWVNWEEAMELLTFESSKNVLRKVLKDKRM